MIIQLTQSHLLAVIQVRHHLHTRLFENIGNLKINFDGYSYGEFGELLSDDHEVNTIHGVIRYNHKYYAITNAFMDWLQEPNKPNRHAFLNNMFCN